MAEYRVTALFYRFTSDTRRDTFVAAAPRSDSLGSFSCTLADGVLEAIPSVEFRDRQAARDALEPHLRDWEESAYLSDRAHRIQFVYDRSTVEEVDPQPGVISLFGEAHGFGFAAATLTIAQRDNAEYPPFDAGFRRTELTERLASRLRSARDDREPWPAFAYFVLTSVCVEYGRAPDARVAAARELRVSRQVLRCLGQISSKGDRHVGRKAAAREESITVAERAWLEAVAVRLIRRVGEHAAGGPLPQITLADFLTSRCGPQTRHRRA
ncbi:MAG TPA: hypothetical protein VLM76_09535 [Patescibacteria group bacterium]|nr:hypothetical protein [Patescibacteria group bacterium]